MHNCLIIILVVANKIYQYQVKLCLQVHLLKCKSRQLVKLCLMKLVHDHILLQSDMKKYWEYPDQRKTTNVTKEMSIIK